ncbi:MAG: MtrAB system histidine kinase MtrB [Micromonosporaceae bacterium]
MVATGGPREQVLRPVDRLRRYADRLRRRAGRRQQHTGAEGAPAGGPRNWWREQRRRLPDRGRRLARRLSRTGSRLRRSRTGLAANRALRKGFRRWRSSLQLRIVTITLLASAVLVAAFGFVVAERITDGLVDAKRDAALHQVDTARRYAHQQLSVLAGPGDPQRRRTLLNLISVLSNVPGRAGAFEVVIRSSDPGIPIDPLSLPSEDNRAVEFVPGQLLRSVADQKVTAHQFTRANPDGGELRPYLAVGTPVQLDWGTLELYYLFPLDEEVSAASLVRNTVLVTGAALVLLLALIAWIMTRLVVNPVRIAARTAQRLSAGLLHERMEVRGEDDLAKLAASFNQMAANLQHQITQLEELSRLQRRFTSDVSHELRTPLTTVRMAADILHHAREQFRPDVARSAELLYAELDRFENLLTDLLEISRFDAGFAHLESEAVDLGPIVRRAVQALERLADSQGVPVEIRMPDQPVIAEVDARRVERILRNLVGNAVEHGEHRPVVVTVAANEAAVAVTVRDHGVGLKRGEETMVFNRFWRADPSRARQTGGTGLGLSISLEDARLHGGWLEAWGAPDSGSSFRLTLPTSSGGRLMSSPLPLVPADAVASAGGER